jgi:hypothetical protein
LANDGAYFLQENDTPWRFVRKSNMLNLSFFYEISKVSKTAWILSSHPSSWTLKPLCPKKLFFALANAIDTDQGNPFEVVNYCLKRIYTCRREVILLAHIGS